MINIHLSIQGAFGRPRPAPRGHPLLPCQALQVRTLPPPELCLRPAQRPLRTPVQGQGGGRGNHLISHKYLFHLKHFVLFI